LQQRAHVTKLHRDLKAIRQSYLSTTHPPRRKQYTRPGSGAEKEKETKYLSDAERNEVDASAKQSLRELNYAIEMLNDAEQMRQVTQSEVALRKRAKKGLGAIGRWAAGGAITAKSVDEEIEESRANTLKAHRESIIWSLQRQLEACGQFQGSMMTIRLEREVEKSKSVLYKTRGTGPAMNNYNEMNDLHSTVPETDYRGKSNYALEESHSEIEQTLDPEQLQLFAQENQDMLKQYEDQLDKVRYVTLSLAVIIFN
jgi:syntaxin 18